MSAMDHDQDGRPVNQFGTPVGPPQAPPPMADPWAPPAPPPGSYVPGVAAPAAVGRRQTLIIGSAIVVSIALIVGSGVLIVPRALDLLRSSQARRTTAAANHGSATPPAPTAPTAPDVPSTPTALTALPPSGSDGVVTPAMTHAVIEAMWPLREQAMYDRDAAALARIETGTALAGDRIRTYCGCIAPGTPRQYSTYETFVMKQTSYPARFVAEVETDRLGPALVDYMGLVRSSAATPWRVEFETWVTNDGQRPLDYDDTIAQFQPAVSRSEQRLIGTTLGRLAAYWQQAKDTGHVPPARWFRPGVWTNQWAAQSAKAPNGRVTGGQMPHVHYRTVPGTPQFIATLDDGWTMACAAFSRTGTIDATKGTIHQGSARQEWGLTLPPGEYRSVHESGYQESCIYLPPHSNGTGVVVVGGGLDEETSYTGVLAASASA